MIDPIARERLATVLRDPVRAALAGGRVRTLLVPRLTEAGSASIRFDEAEAIVTFLAPGPMRAGRDGPRPTTGQALGEVRVGTMHPERMIKAIISLL